MKLHHFYLKKKKKKRFCISYLKKKIKNRVSSHKISSIVTVVYPKIYIDLKPDKIESIYILYDPRLIPPRKKYIKRNIRQTSSILGFGRMKKRIVILERWDDKGVLWRKEWRPSIQASIDIHTPQLILKSLFSI